MSFSIEFRGAEPTPDGGDGPFHLGTTKGWVLLAGWMRSLPAAPEFAAARVLAETGEARDTRALSEALAAGIERHPPMAANVRHSLDALVKLVGTGSADEAAVVTGMDG